jgi:hypothetical protein
MRAMRYSSALAALLLMGSLSLARGDDKVLVPGPVPLTQEAVNRYREMWEWYCDLKLSDAQRKQYEKACISYWKTRPTIVFNSYALSKYREVEKEWQSVRELKGVEQDGKRIEIRDQWMKAARNDTDELSKFLVSVYDTAKKNGKLKDIVARETDKVLVPGDPPLTQAMLDLDHSVLEMLFDCSFTDEQKTESQRLLITEWKGLTQAKKQEFARNLTTWHKISTYRNYERNLQRAFVQTRLLEMFRKPDASERAQYLLKVFEAAYKPGSARNPTLVDSDPTLTQLVVDRYRDYLEVILDLSISGGFTTEQRKVLQEHLVNGWKKMRPGDRKELLSELEAWSKATAPGKPADTNAAISTLRPKLLARLSVDRDDALSKWLLELVVQERKKYELLSAVQKQVHETQMRIIGNIAPDGTWKYNAARGGYEWAPNK